MFKSEYFFFVVIGLIFSCNNKNQQVAIHFSADSTSIIINKIDGRNFFNVEKIYRANPDTVNFFSVFTIPDSTDKLQMEQKVLGKIKFDKNKLIFTPFMPFEKGKSYLIESYINSTFITTNKIVKNKAETNLIPQQQILTR